MMHQRETQTLQAHLLRAEERLEFSNKERLADRKVAHNDPSLMLAET